MRNANGSKEANAAYMRRYREKNPGVREQGRRQVLSYTEAEAILRERHREEFERIYRDRLAANGMPRLKDIPQESQTDG